jgi:hypothetical protein
MATTDAMQVVRLRNKWLNYATSGHCGNKKLRDCKPESPSFSILQRIGPDAEPNYVQKLEAGWQGRLHTRKFGLNDN